MYILPKKDDKKFRHYSVLLPQYFRPSYTSTQCLRLVGRKGKSEIRRFPLALHLILVSSRDLTLELFSNLLSAVLIYSLIYMYSIPRVPRFHYGPKQPKNTDCSTGPLAHPFACSLTPLTRSLAPDCSLARLLCSLLRSWESELLDGYLSVFFFFIFDRSVLQMTRSSHGCEPERGAIWAHVVACVRLCACTNDVMYACVRVRVSAKQR